MLTAPGSCYAAMGGTGSEDAAASGESLLGEADSLGYRRPLPGFSTNDARRFCERPRPARLFRRGWR